MARNLYAWQQNALDVWDALSDKRMTIAAVTGSGKTRVAIEIIDRWAKAHEGLPWMVTILVPGRSLMLQWKSALDRPVGRIGGGHIPGWPSWPRDGNINICTIQKMSKKIPVDYKCKGFEKSHLVIVDECHNLRGKVYRRAMDMPYVASLGLSATPHPDAEATRIVTETCGPVLVRYRYAEALYDRVVPPFRLRVVEIPLTVGERIEYARLTKRIGKAMKRAEYGAPEERVGAYEEVKRLARERKMGLNRCQSRFTTARALLERHADQPTLLFHERTEDLDRLAAEVSHLKPAVYHSNRKDAAQELQRFNNRNTNHLFSCLAITEGFDAPFVQVSIMVSGPNSPLRRIQTVGRCLRGCTERCNDIYFLYVPGTTDERGLNNLLREGSIPASVVTYERRELKASLPKAAHPEQMRPQYGSLDGGWACQWCDLELHRDGTVDLGDWSLGVHAVQHFLTCLECGHTAPECQGLACEHSVGREP